jgi:hypothetical protein
MKAHSNAATDKYLGYVYQVLVAIDHILSADKNQTIWIETYGDVSDETSSTEVKHHAVKKPMSINSVDLWKTLRNWIVEPTDEFSKLIFHTTDCVPNEDTFLNWAAKTVPQRFEFLESTTANKSNKEYHDVVMNTANHEKLKSVLKRMDFKWSQPAVPEICKRLLDAKQLAGVPGKRKHLAFHQIYGYVNEKALIPKQQWQVSLPSFYEELPALLAPFTADRVPFPQIPEPEDISSSNDLPFVVELKSILLPEEERNGLVAKYIRTMLSTTSLLETEPQTMKNAIAEFDAAMLDLADNQKSQIVDEREENVDHKILSRKLVREVKAITPPEIRRVADTQHYFGVGRLNESVNDAKFSWIIKDEGSLP